MYDPQFLPCTVVRQEYNFISKVGLSSGRIACLQTLRGDVFPPSLRLLSRQHGTREFHSVGRGRPRERKDIFRVCARSIRSNDWAIVSHTRLWMLGYRLAQRLIRLKLYNLISPFCLSLFFVCYEWTTSKEIGMFRFFLTIL